MRNSSHSSSLRRRVVFALSASYKMNLQSDWFFIFLFFQYVNYATLTSTTAHTWEYTFFQIIGIFAKYISGIYSLHMLLFDWGGQAHRLINRNKGIHKIQFLNCRNEFNSRNVANKCFLFQRHVWDTLVSYFSICVVHEPSTVYVLCLSVMC